MIKGTVYLLFAIICVLYGRMIRKVGSGTGFYKVWYLIAAFFCVLSLIWFAGLNKVIPAAVFTVFHIIFILVAVVFVAVTALILSGFRKKYEGDLDYIIVLGSQIREDGPSKALRDRLEKADEYLKKHTFATCIVTGGKGYNEPITEAQGMYEYLTASGIESERIILEDKATTTYENLKFSAAFVDRERDHIGIITSDFHVSRSLIFARKLGYRRVEGISAFSNSYYLPNNILREILAFAYEFFIGHM